jgi:hypothetical protein
VFPPMSARCAPELVGLERFELSTFRLSAERSSQTELQAHKHIFKIFHLLKHYLELQMLKYLKNKKF